MKLIRKFNRFTCDTQLKNICFDIRRRQPSKNIRFSLKFKVSAGVWVYVLASVRQMICTVCFQQNIYHSSSLGKVNSNKAGAPECNLNASTRLTMKSTNKNYKLFNEKSYCNLKQMKTKHVPFACLWISYCVRCVFICNAG